MKIIIIYLIEIIVFPPWLLGLPFVPEGWRDAGVAFKEMDMYMDEMLVETRNGEASPNVSNLMTALVGALDKVNLKDRLSDDEIKGSLFVFQMAGHDATANTLAYTFTLLSIDQECRECLRKELLQHIRGDEIPDYETIFPLLIRCQAIMVSSYPPTKQ